MAPPLHPHESFLLSDAFSFPNATEVQMRLFREMGPEGRSRLAFELSETAIAIARQSLQRRMPRATKQEIDIAWIELAYGEELARTVAEHLRSRESPGSESGAPS